MSASDATALPATASFGKGPNMAGSFDTSVSMPTEDQALNAVIAEPALRLRRRHAGRGRGIPTHERERWRHTAGVSRASGE